MLKKTFGTIKQDGHDAEYVLIRSNVPHEECGYQQYRGEYADSIETHTYHIVKKIKDSFVNGMYYVWYEIDTHSWFVDSTKPLKHDIDNHNDDIMLLLEMCADQEEEIAELILFGGEE